MIALCIVGIIFSTACACFNLVHHKPFFWIPLTVNILCVLLYVLMLLGAIQRRLKVRKHMCDCCGGELAVPKKDEGMLALFQDISIFRARAIYKITQFTLSIPFGISNHRDMDICEKCMTDFKEFVQRKSTYMNGEKK